MGIDLIKPVLAAAAALAALPLVANAQEINAQPGFYIGGGGGLVVPLSAGSANGGQVGWVAGGKVGYDFVGPRLDLDVGYSQLPLTINIPGTALNGKAGQLTALVNLSYDFFPTSTITPYVGAGLGMAFIDSKS